MRDDRLNQLVADSAALKEKELANSIAKTVVETLVQQQSFINDRWLTWFVIFETIIGLGIIGAIIFLAIKLSAT